MFAFYIPCIIILFLYWKIYLMIKDFNLRRRPSTMSSQDEASSTGTDTSMRPNIAVSPSPSISRSSSYNAGQINKVGNDFARSDSQKSTQRSTKRKRRWTLKRSNSMTSSRKERKYAIVLAIVVVTFIGCWLPFFIIYLLQLCSCAANLALPEAFNATTWLGWCNSLINPIIYTIFNTDFRKAFRRIVFCEKRHRRREYSSENK